MNQELEKVHDWFRINKLSLNIKKTNYVLFCSHRKKVILPKETITLNDIPIPQATSVKFLGVFVDQHLTWNDHIENISSKIAKSIGILSRVAYLLPTHIRISLYYSIIHPYFSYCNMIWASNYPARLKRLIVLQNRALRIIVNQARHSSTYLSTDLAFQDTHILKLEQLTILQTSEFMHKYTNNQLPSSFNNYFKTTSQSNPYPVRSSANYRPIYSRTNTRRFSIKSAGPKIWNSIPNDIRYLTSFHLFKRRLRAYLIANGTF
jgi:hypothetical protein